MNSTSPETCVRKTGAAIYVLGILGTFLVVGALVWLMRSYTQPPSLFEVRGAERLKIKSDYVAANAPMLDPDSYVWQDPTRNIVRIPIDQAKELILKEWANPTAGRSLLTNRAVKAFAPVKYD
jgi:hypothetical protein